ncbi:non-ribosomal peptide synthetase, partial [Actinoplanes rectilineatus]|uniref:non-ribosomal peptide synthetase n=1 Tax=Actinoplanes rectilineatus TaxID=113571 RepID=UPI0005F2875E
VAGDGVSDGYLGDPEKTAQRFLPGGWYRTGDLGSLLPDGTLVYLGRADRQVQLKGYRIELGEVEAALHAVPGVSECVVRLDEKGAEPRLVAWLVTGERDDRAIRAALKPLLPAYMIPSLFCRVERLPLTANGKVDDAALTVSVPEETRAPSTGVPHADEIAEIWRQVIGIDTLSYDDNFFDIGGTSMHVAEIHRRLVDRFVVDDIKMVDLFEYPTVNALAGYLTDLRNI